MSYSSVYPPAHSDTYVKATTKYSTDFWPYYATDPLKPLIGADTNNAWQSASGQITNQRFHIDLGEAKTIKRIYYENEHHNGTYTNYGVKNFTFWGSNEASAFADLVYGDDTNWTQLTTSVSYFDQHVAQNIADPKYITVTNTTGYRYYAFKFADNYGSSYGIGVRRIELQIEEGSIAEDISANDIIDSLIDEIKENVSVSANLDSLTDLLDEDVSASAEFAIYNPLYDSIAEDIAAYAEFTGLIAKPPSEEVSVSVVFEGINALSVTDNMDFGDTSTPRLSLAFTFTDNMNMDDTPTPSLSFAVTLTDILFLWDALQHGWSVTAEDKLTLTDNTAEVLGLIINEWINLVDSQTNNWNGQEIIVQNLNLYDLAEQAKMFFNTVTESLSVTDNANYALTIAVLEYLGFTDVATALKTCAESVNESLGLTDFPTHALLEIIEEFLAVVDVAGVIATFVNVVHESLSAADSVAIIKKINAFLNESLELTETISSNGRFYNVVYDTIALNVSIELEDDVYECYVLNTPKFHPSMYSGFDFNSYCVYNNRAFGANNTGIYELTGSTDAGETIHTGAILHQTDFGLRNQKRFRKGYLGISGTSPVMVFECEDGSRKVYNIDTNGMVVVSQEQKSRKWKLSIAEFEKLDIIKLIPIILSR